MKIYIPVIFLITFLFLNSCKPKQNVVYMSNDNFQEEVSRARFTGLHIQEGDKLQITVSAFDELAVRPFNRSTMTGTGNAADGGSGGGGTASS